MTENLIKIILSIAIILIGIPLLKGGIRSYKNKEKMIGTYSPSGNAIYGIILIVGGFSILFKILYIMITG